MRTNCLQPIEPLSIYRLLSRYSLRVNEDSNLLRRVLSECWLCFVERNRFMLCSTLVLKSTFDGAVLIDGFDPARLRSG